MTGHAHPADLSRDHTRLDHLAAGILRGGLASAFVGILLAVFLALSPGGEKRFFFSYLHNFVFFLSLLLGGMFFVLIQHLTRATWSVAVRRLAEGIAANAWLTALLFLPVLFGMRELYEWLDPQAVAHDALLQGKAPYLNRTFFLVRCAAYFAVWIGLGRWFLSRSTTQDRSGDPAITVRMQKISAPGMVLFALTLTFAAFDLVMSLDPHWYSTIFGVYFFAGSVVGGISLLVVLAYTLQGWGRLARVIGPRHYYDMGTLLFAFTVFWAYIAFSQYMLIWYSNISEETAWFLPRRTGSWSAVAMLLVFGHFLVPFFFLMSRWVKRRRGLVALAAVWMLAMHWVDLYWLIMPEFSPAGIRPHVLDAACLLAVGGLFMAGVAFNLRPHSLVPVKDPRLADSLASEAV